MNDDFYYEWYFEPALEPEPFWPEPEGDVTSEDREDTDIPEDDEGDDEW